ncbi:hypothetical protein [Hymenobacter glacieicola]|uniref:HTH cro/C1-type domain-containing protein n=1 Tax=Hymenobacter glacieicola TaxID=1562124 RepID=A0ABQ1X4D9_9BACT|nr:hypothetical protein [Hymenobacter glacieicola]GGG59435.1 hypothetical protein GCM10011378_39270 [Hymenobacter glacieicola]
MKTPKPAPLTIQVLPLEREQPPKVPVACRSLAELIHSLGTRKEVSEAWKVVPRTLVLRMQKPETATLEELQRLAELAKLDLPTVFELAYYQMRHPVVVPTPQLGRPKHH